MVLCSCQKSTMPESSTALKRSDYDVARSMSDYVYHYTELEEIEEASELIIVGTIIEESRQEMIRDYEPYFGKDVVVDGYRYVKVRIEKSYKGIYQAGDVIEVVQNLVYLDDIQRLFNKSPQLPLEIGDTWFMFLGEWKGAYGIVCDYYGCYPLPENLSSNAASGMVQSDSSYENLVAEEFGVYEPEIIQLDLCKEILSKYDFGR